MFILRQYLHFYVCCLYKIVKFILPFVYIHFFLHLPCLSCQQFFMGFMSVSLQLFIGFVSVTYHGICVSMLVHYHGICVSVSIDFHGICVSLSEVSRDSCCQCVSRLTQLSRYCSGRVPLMYCSSSSLSGFLSGHQKSITNQGNYQIHLTLILFNPKEKLR